MRYAMRVVAGAFALAVIGFVCVSCDRASGDKTVPEPPPQAEPKAGPPVAAAPAAPAASAKEITIEHCFT